LSTQGARATAVPAYVYFFFAIQYITYTLEGQARNSFAGRAAGDHMDDIMPPPASLPRRLEQCSQVSIVCTHACAHPRLPSHARKMTPPVHTQAERPTSFTRPKPSITRHTQGWWTFICCHSSPRAHAQQRAHTPTAIHSKALHNTGRRRRVHKEQNDAARLYSSQALHHTAYAHTYKQTMPRMHTQAWPDAHTSTAITSAARTHAQADDTALVVALPT
jgi:hypothetical protein